MRGRFLWKRPRVFTIYIFSGAETPSRARQLAITARTVSDSLSRAARTSGAGGTPRPGW